MNIFKANIIIPCFGGKANSYIFSGKILMKCDRHTISTINIIGCKNLQEHVGK